MSQRESKKAQRLLTFAYKVKLSSASMKGQSTPLRRCYLSNCETHTKLFRSLSLSLSLAH